MLVQVYGVEAVSKSVCLSGLNALEMERKVSRMSCIRVDHPQAQSIQQRMSAIDDRRLSLRMIAEVLKISKDSVNSIVHKHLGKQKICARFVSHMLTNEQKQTRMETFGDFIDTCDRNHNFWKSLLLKMRPGATNVIWRPNDSQWYGVHCFPCWQNPGLRRC